MTTQFVSQSEVDTRRFGLVLGRLLFDGAVVALNGPLGAGKTRLVQAVAEARGHERSEVVSPTFTLIQEYRGPRPVYHFDAYRLRDDDEFLNLGPDEYFDGDGVTIVEWGERVSRCLPSERLEITICPTGPETREFGLSAQGTRYRQLLSELLQNLASSPAPENG
ncbi:MAG: tRNA (adenosine(37)-N6)-threonylcarbamoyltransferase complex ATPase subunit type 1 TsaE [Planctomycetes bacterium]|nr:tRNA (adenosine(37)-N6)-threonylcarbamoyltransferase complex ATPase subunit type 1 TsaE [Planctomycetota bacterium]